ncbi:GcrE [Corynebacterium belfantii]|uniref:DnaB-like helicase N-terminal domain-containing protein n=1 Tax=Corynebacterium belfantii TaxID=2014537 RepID=UPI0018D37FDC|nr:DnaB-like helicase N-terminal domain-containing protein [Corynebacterium belfantii]MBG9328871.1 GcrE [Corynebacterium belfantii]
MKSLIHSGRHTATHNAAPNVTGDDLAAAQPPADYEIRLDPEALLLCALMNIEGDPHGEAGVVLDYLHPTDFYRPTYGDLFAVMQRHRATGDPLHPAAINATLANGAEEIAWSGGHHTKLLINLYGLNSIPSQIGYYAEQVLAESYRRSFASMARFLAQAAEFAAETDLFPLMVEHGKKQRQAWARRQGLAPLLRGETE